MVLQKHQIIYNIIQLHMRKVNVLMFFSASEMDFMVAQQEKVLNFRMAKHFNPGSSVLTVSALKSFLLFPLFPFFSFC